MASTPLPVRKSAGDLATVADGTTLHYLSFSLGDEIFAMDIDTVREIIQFSSITVVPLMPAFVRGVINLRGAVVPVIDLSVRFGRRRSEVGKKTCVIIFDSHIDGERVELGIMVDAVSEVIDVPRDQIEPPPQFGCTIQRDYIHGMVKVDGEFVVIIEPDRALSVEEMARLAEQEQLARVF